MAGFKEMMSADNPVKFQLNREMELEEIYEKMNSRASEFKMPFKLKKGIMGKSIQFDTDKDLELSIRVTVKGKEVTVKPIVKQNQTSVGAGGFQVRVDRNSALRKGVKGVLNMPIERQKCVKATADTIQKILG